MMNGLTVLVKVRDKIGLRLELVGKFLSIEMLDVALLRITFRVVDHLLVALN